MNESLIKELRNNINNLKIDILEKQQELNKLIEEYQNLSGMEFEEIEDEIEE